MVKKELNVYKGKYMEIKVMKSILDANENVANDNRKLMEEKKIRLFNIIGSPGAGKTTILENIIGKLKDKFRIAVIEGDCATDRDAQRLKKFDIPIVLINTEGGCYLPSISIKNALAEIDLDDIDIVFIENVGNLVCPAHFDVGENIKIAVASVAEGDDKPAKYPLLFSEAKVVILNKIDLIEYTNFNKDIFYRDLKKLNPSLTIFELSSTKNTGLVELIKWF